MHNRLSLSPTQAHMIRFRWNEHLRTLGSQEIRSVKQNRMQLKLNRGLEQLNAHHTIRCKCCGEPIRFARLRDIPGVERCLPCDVMGLPVQTKKRTEDHTIE